MKQNNRIGVVLLLALLAVGSFVALMWFARAATVIDRSGQVASARIEYDEHRSGALIEFWPDRYAALGLMEGELIVSCTNGGIVHGGYASLLLNTTLDDPCPPRAATS